MSDPLDVLTKALKAKWEASATLDGIAGPYDTEEAPAEASHPYGVYEFEKSKLLFTSVTNEYWEHRWIVRVWHSEKTTAKEKIEAVDAVFDPDQLTLSLDSGTLVRARRRQIGYDREDKLLYSYMVSYSFVTTRPRT